MENDHKFYGKHIIAEFYGVENNLINDLDFFVYLLEIGIKKAEVHSEGMLFKKFDPQGLTILVLLSESHISIHTYPENNSIFFDIFTCGEANPNIILELFLSELNPKHKTVKILERGI